MPNSSWALRAASAGMTILFTVWAYYQLNDVDPLHWVTIYAVAALFSLLFMFGKLAPSLALTAGIVCLTYAIYLFTQAEFGPPLITIEEWREAIGLLVIGGWMGVIVFNQRRLTSEPLPLTRNAD